MYVSTCTSGGQHAAAGSSSPPARARRGAAAAAVQQKEDIERECVQISLNTRHATPVMKMYDVGASKNVQKGAKSRHVTVHRIRDLK